MADDKLKSALNYEYGAGEWWCSSIQSYACMKLTMRKQGLEQNHLVHAAFFRNGPSHVQGLAAYVPCLTLSMEEHRGEKYSYHKMKDGEKVGSGKDSFQGCGMDAFLRSNGINVNAGSFSIAEIAKAISMSVKYWEMIGIDHAAAALREFNTRVFAPVAKER
jgi:hypothetical protein